MAVELAEGLEPSFAFHGLSRSPDVGEMGSLETRRIEHVVAIAELLQGIERGFHKGVDLLARQDRACRSGSATSASIDPTAQTLASSHEVPTPSRIMTATASCMSDLSQCRPL